MQTLTANYFSWWDYYKQHVRNVILNNSVDSPEKVSHWRNAGFCTILTYLTPLSVIALVPSVIMAFLNGVPVIGFVDLTIFFTIVAITVLPGIKLETRKALFIFLIYCLSVVLLYFLPLPGPGLLFLLTVTIFSSLIYSSAAAYYSAWTNTAICVCFALLIFFGTGLPLADEYNTPTWIAISSNLILLSFACAKGLDLLLAGLSRSLETNKLSEAKLEKAIRLYQFISQINQTIVHVKDPETLFRDACRIAVAFGKYEMAWIGGVNNEQNKITPLESCGIPEYDLHRFAGVRLEDNHPQSYVMHTGGYFLCNDIANTPALESWKRTAAKLSIGSCIVLPIKKSGNLFGTFSLYATKVNYFDDDDIALLLEVTADISFALDLFEKADQHKAAEALVLKNEKLFRALTEKSVDMKTLATAKGELTYASPSVTKVLGYSEEEFLELPAFSLIHPEDIAGVADKIHDVLQSSGKSFTNQHRLLHKNGNWIWTEGSLTNMLHEPGIEALVSNFRDISEKKKAEEQKEFDRLDKEALINSTNDLIWSITKDFKLIAANTSFIHEIKKYTGVVIKPGDNLIEQGVYNEAYLKYWEELYNKAYAGETFKNEIYTPAAPGRDESWTETSFSPITVNGTIAGVACYSRNITERKKSELLLRANEARLAEAQAMAKIGSWETNLSNLEVIWSEQTYRIFDGEPDDFDSTHHSFLSFVHPDDRTKVEDAFNASFGKNTINSIEHRIITKKGNVKYVEERWQILRDENDVPVKAVGTSQDITERKKSEQENKFKAVLLDTIGQAVLATDMNGNVTFWNKAATEIYGWSVEEALGENILGLTPSKQSKEEAAVLMQKLSKGETWSGEFYVKRKNGSEFPAFVFNSPVYDEFGKQIGIIGVSSDISERKEHEQERTKITNELLQRNRDLEQFTFIVSHNLRAPTANIIGITGLLQSDSLSAQQRKEFLQGLSTSVTGLDNIIKDINSILQVKKEVNEKRETVVFSRLVEDISVSIGNIMEKNNVCLQTDFSKVDDIFSLKVYLHSIFYNLISNSIKYRKPDELPRIEIKSTQDNGKIILTFKDNGLGIDMKKKGDKVFGLYKRFHSHVEGKGMGLFMVKTQVEAIGGTITVESELNKGTQFTIVFEK